MNLKQFRKCLKATRLQNDYKQVLEREVKEWGEIEHPLETMIDEVRDQLKDLYDNLGADWVRFRPGTFEEPTTEEGGEAVEREKIVPPQKGRDERITPKAEEQLPKEPVAIFDEKVAGEQAVTLTPAIRGASMDDDKVRIYVGRSHADARNASTKAGHPVMAEYESEQGFLYKGEFISREEAAKLFKDATGRELLKGERGTKNQLSSEDLDAANLLGHLQQSGEFVTDTPFGKPGKPDPIVETARVLGELSGRVNDLDALSVDDPDYGKKIKAEAKKLKIRVRGRELEDIRADVISILEQQKEHEIIKLAQELNVEMDDAIYMLENFDPSKKLDADELSDDIQDLNDVAEATEPQPEPQKKGEEPTIYTIPDEDLEDYLSGAFDVLDAKRRGDYTFDTYIEMKRYIEDRYRERDLEGMALALKEAEGPWKTRYVRENAKAKPHKKAWISHILTGSPLPVEDPPLPRTTPRPTARGTDEPKAPEAPQGPRRPREDFPTEEGDPSPYEKFHHMALVQLLDMFGLTPKVRKRMKEAWGRYRYAKGWRGEMLPFLDNEVLLQQMLQANDALATRVLSHEVGHFIDLGTRPEGMKRKTGKSKEFWQKLTGLNLLADDLMPPAADATKNQKRLLDEAKSLSAEWRGPFNFDDNKSKYGKYRNDPRELFADYMSAMFLNPGFVKKHYPFLHDHFATLLENKPEFRRAYQFMQEFLSTRTLDQRVENKMDAAVDKTVEVMTMEKKKESRSWLEFLRGAFVTKYGRARDVEGAKGLASTLIDLVETVHTWGSMQDALTADTLNQEMVPELEKVGKVKPDLLHNVRVTLSGRAPTYSAKQQQGMEKARKELHKYNTWSRIIWERRAAGRFIEQNADRAREILETIFAGVLPLNQKWLEKMRNTPDSQLYDFFAKVALDINSMGIEETVIDLIDGMEDLDVTGQAILTAFNVRGKLLNPEGITARDAARLLRNQRERFIREDLNYAGIKDAMNPDVSLKTLKERNPNTFDAAAKEGVERYEALRKAAGALKREMYMTQLKAYREGLVNPKIWEEIISQNPDSYVPFSVLDNFEGSVAAGVLPQKGTALPIADTTIATLLKMSALNRWRQRQRQVRLLKKMYEKGDGKVVLAKLKKASDIHRKREQNRGDDISRGVIYIQGKPWMIEFHGDKGKTLERAITNEDVYGKLDVITKMGETAHQVMQLYTSFTTSFMFFRNPIRGLRTGVERVGLTELLKVSNPFSGVLYNSMAMAFNYANAAKGLTMRPEVKQLVQDEVLMAPRMAAGMLRDIENLTDLMAAGSAYVNQLYRLRSTVPRPAETLRGKIMQMAGLPFNQTMRFTTMPVLRRLQYIFTAYEAFEKIQNYKAAQMKWADQKNLVNALARRSGIPKPGVGGYYSMPLELGMPWMRVALQGLRADLETAQEPETRAGFITRLFLTEGMPRIYRFLVASGVIAGGLRFLLHDDEDPEDTIMAEVYRRISPYKLGVEDVIPMWFYDPRNGEYTLISEAPWRKGSEIPEHLEIVSFRMPASEQGRTFGPLLWNMLVQTSPQKDKLGRPGSGPLEETYRWATNFLLPGLSPVIETGQGLSKMILEGKNPDDPYTGYPSANPQYFDAGWGNGRGEAVIGYIANQLGGPGYLGGQMLAMSGLIDRDVLKTTRLRDFTEMKDPWYLKDPTGTMRAFISHDNYARYRERKLKNLEEEEIRAITKRIMPQEVKDMYQFYWKNRDRKDQMDPIDYGKLRAASQFVSKVWGNLDDPDSFYNKSAYAMTSGSEQNKETVKRDLLAAAQPWIALYKDPEAVRISTVLHLSNKDTAKVALSPVQHQVYDRKRKEIQDTYYDKLRNLPQWNTFDQERQHELKLAANQLAREQAAKWLIANPQEWRKP